jgi:hypothetical protein
MGTEVLVVDTVCGVVVSEGVGDTPDADWIDQRG